MLLFRRSVFRRAFEPLLFHRLAEAVAFAVHLEDMTMMRQTVQQSGRHPFALEDLDPFAKRQITGDQQTASFVAIGEHLKQQFGARTGSRSGAVCRSGGSPGADA